MAVVHQCLFDVPSILFGIIIKDGFGETVSTNPQSSVRWSKHKKTVVTGCIPIFIALAFHLWLNHCLLCNELLLTGKKCRGKQKQLRK